MIPTPLPAAQLLQALLPEVLEAIGRLKPGAVVQVGIR